MSISHLSSRQNPDGGWAYNAKASWTEPTVYAVMACLAAGEEEASRRGVAWLRAAQRPDGGWPPQPAVEESTWVTSLVAMLPPEVLGRENHSRAIDWLLDVTGQESTRVYRLRQWMLGNPLEDDGTLQGWPWVPGTAVWVGPTSLALMALRKEHRRNPRPETARRIEYGRRFLLNRCCDEGGWNHGGVRALGYQSRPYPETTGMALAALCGVRATEVDRGLTLARQFLLDCRSSDALCWLRLGLLAHEGLPAGFCPPEFLVRSPRDTALAMLMSTDSSAREVFLA